jgi:hypothetical protein
MTSTGNRATGSARRARGLILRGVGAGTVGTLAMDILLYRRYRHAGGKDPFAGWESSEGLKTWDGAPAPALVAKRLLEGVLHDEVSPRYARGLNNAMHWGFGLANGAGYGLLLGSRQPKVWWGLPFGAAVWLSGYAVLPVLGVYKPIWEYDRETLAGDLRAHCAFGTATAAAFAVLAQRQVHT